MNGSSVLERRYILLPPPVKLGRLCMFYGYVCALCWSCWCHWNLMSGSDLPRINVWWILPRYTDSESLFNFRHHFAVWGIYRRFISIYYTHQPLFTKISKMTDADKGMNPLNFESDPADIRIRIRNPDHLVGRGNRSARGQVKYILQFLYRVFWNTL